MDLLKPVLERFDEICRFSRCSSSEGAIRKWITDWASAHSFHLRSDGSGNLCIDIPASAGRENEPGLVLQAHQDMVCETRSGITHDFAGGVTVERDGDWLLSRDTTLGADDGMGIALITGVCGALDGHPPLELLFTSNEESGMSGAQGLQPGFLRGRMMLNLDSEKEGAFTIGCAGLRFADLTLAVRRFRPSVRGGLSVLSVEVHDASGGHSAMDIHRNGANAVLLLARLMPFLRKRCDLHLLALKAGEAPNMIARDAALSVAVPAAAEAQLREAVTAAASRFREEFASTDPALRLSCESARSSGTSDDTGHFVTAESTARISELLLALPHGVERLFDSQDQGIVHTSANLAGCELSGGSGEKGELKVYLSVRSADVSGMDQVKKRIEAVGALAGARVSVSGEIAPWRAREPSAALDRALRAYRAAHRTAARKEFAHGMLECGVIAQKIPEMDMISTGPTIEGAHAPGERVSIRSVERVANFIEAFVGAAPGDHPEKTH